LQVDRRVVVGELGPTLRVPMRAPAR